MALVHLLGPALMDLWDEFLAGPVRQLADPMILSDMAHIAHSHGYPEQLEDIAPRILSGLNNLARYSNAAASRIVETIGRWAYVVPSHFSGYADRVVPRLIELYSSETPMGPPVLKALVLIADTNPDWLDEVINAMSGHLEHTNARPVEVYEALLHLVYTHPSLDATRILNWQGNDDDHNEEEDAYVEELKSEIKAIIDE